ncbi:MAG: tetratricopeptide repeat protein [Bacteroidota bacterium]
MPGSSPVIVAGTLSALGSVALDCTTGGAVTGAGVGLAAAKKGLDLVTSFGQGAASDALKARFSSSDDYREVQANRDLDAVLHRAVADTVLQVADRWQTGDERSAEALRYIARDAGGVLKPMESDPNGALDPVESLRLVEVFATTSAELRASGEGAEGGGRTLSRDNWKATVDRFVRRAKGTVGWRKGKHVLAPEAIADLVKTLHTGFPKAVRNVMAQDAETGGRAFAKLTLLMLGETLAQVRHLRQQASGETVQKTESEIIAETRAFRRTLSRTLREDLGEVSKRFDDFAKTVEEEHKKTRGLISAEAEKTREEIRALAKQQLDAAQPAPSLAPIKRTDHFMGREDAIAETLAALDAHPVVFVCGPGGIGKSTLVRHLYDEALQRPWAADGADYIDLRTQETASGAVGEVAAQLSLTEVRDATGLLGAMATRGRRLYILDDFQQAYRGDTERAIHFLRDLTTHDRGMRVLVTMRSRPDIPTPRYVEPGRLKTPYDADLFRALTPDHAWTDADTEPLAELLSELNGHPLSLVLVAGRLRREGTVSALLAAWREDPLRLAAVSGIRRAGAGGLSAEESLEVSLGFSYAALDSFPASVRALFVLFADLPAGASPEMLRALGVEDEAEALVRLGLLHEEGNRTAALVPVRLFAASKHADVPEAEALRQKLDGYLQTFAEATRARERYGPWVHAVVAEMPNVFAAVDRAHARDDARYVAEVTAGVAEVMGWETFARPETPGRLRAARDAFRDIGSRLGEANAEKSLGDVHYMRAEYDEARRSYTAARDAFRDIGDRLGEANAERGLGRVHSSEKLFDEAHAALQRALALHTEIGNTYGIGSTWEDIGRLERARGDLPAACAAWRTSLAQMDAIGLGHLPWVQSMREMVTRFCPPEVPDS